MSYTTPMLVQKILGADYGPLPDGTLPDLQQYVDTADVTVLRMQGAAALKGISYTSAELELIERWLAAHAYKCMDQQLSSKGQGGVSGSYKGSGGTDFSASLYGQQAMQLDWAGILKNLSKPAGRQGLLRRRRIGTDRNRQPQRPMTEVERP